MKKIYAILISVLVLGSMHVQASDFEGFTVGLGVGYVKPEVKYTDNSNNPGKNYKWDNSDSVFQVSANYDNTINDQWLVGIGLTYDLNNTNAGTETSGYGPVETFIKDHRSVYVQPTFILDSSSAVFATLGLHQGRVNALGKNGAFWVDDKFQVHGIGYGVGYKKIINTNIIVQAELQVVDYKDKTLHDNTGYVWAYEQKTSTGIFTVGYKF